VAASNVPALNATPSQQALFEAQAPRRARRAEKSAINGGAAAGKLKSRAISAIEFVNVAHSIPESYAARDPHAGRHVGCHTWRLEDRSDPRFNRRPDRREEDSRRWATKGCSRSLADFPPIAVREGRSPSEVRRRQDACRTPSAAAARAGWRSQPSRPTSGRNPRGRRRCPRRRPRMVLVGGRWERVTQVAPRGPAISRAVQDFPQPRKLRLSAPRQGLGAVHRQPGRAARRALADRRSEHRGHPQQGIV